MKEAEHIVALRKSFPGVWIREDGAFRDDDIGLHWSPGDVEREDCKSLHPNTVANGFAGLCCFVGNSHGGRAPALRLSQLQTLSAYIKAVSDKEDGE